MIKFYSYLAVLSMLLINTTMQAQKIEGAGIPPSKVQAYSNESAQYSVSGLEGRLSWDVFYGHASSPFGFSQTEITWNTTPEGKIVVRNDKNESVEVTVQVAPPAPKYLKNFSIKDIEFPNIPIFSDIKDCSYYQITPPIGCTVNGYTNAFRKKKELTDDKNVLITIANTPKQLYYEGDLKVQAIFDSNSLLSRVTTYKYKYLDLEYLKTIQTPDSIDYSNQKTYTIEVEKIEEATYKWNLENGEIISGQNTNKIIVKPNFPLWKYNISLDFTYHGITKNKSISIPTPMNLYIDGPTDIYNGTYEYTLKSPYTIVEEKYIFMWTIDAKTNPNFIMKNKFTINADILSPGSHHIRAITDGPHIIDKYITKHSALLYKIECKSQKLVVSKSEENILLPANSNSATIQIYNQQGVLVLSKEANLNTNRFESDLNSLKKGIYFVIVTDGKIKTEEKIIIR